MTNAMVEDRQAAGAIQADGPSPQHVGARKRLGGWQRKLNQKDREIEFLQAVVDRCFARLGKQAMAQILEGMKGMKRG